MKIPGGCMARAVTGGGVDVEVDEDIWKGAILSSFMRTTMLHPNLLVGVEVPNLAVLPSHERFPSSLQDEALLLDAAKHLMGTGRIKQARERLHYDAAKGCRSEHIDVVSLALLNHFTHVQRVSVLQNIFHEMAADFNDPIQAIYEANCMRYLGKQEEALQYLEYSLSLVEQDVADVEDYGEVFSPLYTAVAELCADLDGPNSRENLEFGLEAAGKAVGLDPTYRPARIILARLRAASCLDTPNTMAGYQEALLALNQIQPPHDIEETEDILVLIPQWSRIVEPRDPRTNIDTKMMATLKEEFEEFGREKLMQLPGNILVPHKMLLTHDYYLYNFASAIRREVYLILVEIVAELDWDPFLQLRTQTFFMDAASSGSEEDYSDDEDDDEEEDGDEAENSDSENEARVAVSIDIVSPKKAQPKQGMAEESEDSQKVAEVAVDIPEDPGGEGGDEEPPGAPSVTQGEGNEEGDTGEGPGEEREPLDDIEIEIERKIEEKRREKEAMLAKANAPKPQSPPKDAKIEVKEVCSIWLDEMIFALYSDLAEYVEFRLHLKNIKKTIDNDFEVTGEYETRLDEKDDEDPDTDEEITAVSMLSGENVSADWFRRGILAERIFRPEEADRSHRAALNTKFKMVSCITLLRVYAETQQLKQACEMAARALTALRPDHWRDDSSTRADLPFAIQDAFFHMIARSGLQAVRKQVGAKCPAAFNEIFHQAVEWHIAGFAH